MKLYLVSGAIGTYADEYEEWPVILFADRDSAHDYCNRCYKSIEGLHNLPEEDRISPYDPKVVNLNHRLGFSSIRYFIVEVDFYNHIDQFLEEKQL